MKNQNKSVCYAQRKTIASDGRYMETRYYVTEGSDQVLLHDGTGGPFKVLLKEARRRWRADAAKGWVEVPR